MQLRQIFPAVGFIGLWVVLAAFTPDVSYHLAPLIVAAMAAFSFRESRIQGAIVGFGLAAVAAVALSGTGLMLGPSLLPIGGPLFEAVLGAAAGAFIGVALFQRLPDAA